MARVLARTVRLLKFGAVAGALVGVGRLVLMRRRRSETGESSWPTIAETAAQNGQTVDDGTDSGAPEPQADADSSSASSEQADSADTDGAGDDTEDKA